MAASAAGRAIARVTVACIDTDVWRMQRAAGYGEQVSGLASKLKLVQARIDAAQRALSDARDLDDAEAALSALVARKTILEHYKLGCGAPAAAAA